MKRNVLAPIAGVLVAVSVARAAPVDDVMPTVLLEAKDESSTNVSDVRVTMDGAPLLDRLNGAAIAVNPGQHHLVFDAAGFRRTETTFVVRQGQKRFRVVVFLDSAGSPAPNQLIVSPDATPPGRPEEQTSSAGRRQNIALALGGAAIVGVTVGSIFSVLSKVTYDHALSTGCGGDANQCTSQGIADGRTAHRQAAVATVSFVAAGALLAAGAALYFTSPKDAAVAVAPTVDRGAGLAVLGKW
jgi:hypothetical protein